MVNKNKNATRENVDASQLEEWRGEFGEAYIERNLATPERVRQRAAALSQIFVHIEDAPPHSVVEVGANVGLNLRALQTFLAAELIAVEPNGSAY